MRKDNKAIVLYVILLLIILTAGLTVTIFVIPSFFQDTARIAILIVWIVMAIIATPVENDHTRFKGKKEKIKTTLIIVIIYYILYFLLGLIFGYNRSPYSRNFFTIIKNLLCVVGVVVLQDYVRTKLINNQRKKFNYIAFTIVFILLRLDYTEGIAAISSGEKIFEYMSSVVIPEIAKGCVCSYLAITGGTLLVYAYSVPVALIQVLLPNLNWFLTSVFDVLISLILFMYNNYEHNIKTIRLTRKEKKKINPIKKVPIICLLLISVVFIAGILPAKPVAIMSYSMVPTFSRGAVVISVKVSEKNLNKLQIGDILHYRAKNGDVIHRIIDKKEENGTIIFKTQGDNNNVPDGNWVQPEQVIGRVKIYIPYIGYPSVWFSEKVLGVKSFITI